MKSTILLTTALFLASAPAPDPKTISELSAGFLSVGNDYSLMASDSSLDRQFDPVMSSQLALQVNETHEPAIYESARADIGMKSPREQMKTN